MASKGGRPPYKPTAAQRLRVSVAAGAGWRHEEIALALGISQPTLRKHFERELSVGAYHRRMEVVQALYRAAKKGNVQAVRHYTELTPRAAAAPLSAPVRAPVAAAPTLQGKKAQANAEARTAHVGTDWDSLLSPPPLAQ